MTGEQIRDAIQALHDDLVAGTELLRRQIRAARDEMNRKVEQLRTLCPHDFDEGLSCKWCECERSEDEL